MKKYNTLAKLLIMLELADIKENTNEYKDLRGFCDNFHKNKVLKNLKVKKEDVKELAELIKIDFKNEFWEQQKSTMPLYNSLLQKKKFNRYDWMCWDDHDTEVCLKRGNKTNVIGMLDYDMWEHYLDFLNKIVDKQLKQLTGYTPQERRNILFSK
jgi:hypothetical protein